MNIVALLSLVTSPSPTISLVIPLTVPVKVGLLNIVALLSFVTLPKPTIAFVIPLTVPVKVGLSNIVALLSLVTLPNLVLSISSKPLSVVRDVEGTGSTVSVSSTVIIPSGVTLTAKLSIYIVFLLIYKDLNFLVAEPKFNVASVDGRILPAIVTVPVKVGLVNIVTLLSLVTLPRPTIALVRPVTLLTPVKLGVPVKAGLASGAFNAS